MASTTRWLSRAGIFVLVLCAPSYAHASCPGVAEEVYGGEPQVAISTVQRADETRRCLQNFIWPLGFPSAGLPTTVDENITDSNYSSIGAARIDRLTFELPFNITTVAFLFYPSNPEPSHTLIIEHGGHEWSRGLLAEKEPITKLVARGYFVLAIPQVLMGRDVTNIPPPGPPNLPDHDSLAPLKTENFNPLSLFLDPAVKGLNYVLAHHTVSRVAMLGLSGGGWTTTMMAALDPRIERSYSVAGSVPLYLRPPPPEGGDWEQLEPDLYRIANYEDLYLLAGYGPGRSHLQILLHKDSIPVFRNPDYQPYRRLVQARITGLGQPAERFQVFLDMEATSHYISGNAANTILRDLEQGHFDVNSPESIITGGPGPSAGKDVTFHFGADEPAIYACSFDDNTFVPCHSPVSYTDLSEGTHRFRVFATDTLGNVDGTPASREVTVDLIAPETTIESESGEPTSFRFISSEGGPTFECSIDGGAFGACSSPYSTDALSAGYHLLEVRAIDAAGNIDPTPASRAFALEAPAVAPPLATPSPFSSTPELDTVSPRLLLRVRRSQNVLRQKGIVVLVECVTEGCTALAAGSVTVPAMARSSASKRFHLRSVTRWLSPSVRVKLKLRLSQGLVRRIQRTFRSPRMRNKVRARVSVTVTDAAANRRNRKLTVRLGH